MNDLITYLTSDLHRFYGKTTLKIFIKVYFKKKLYRFMFWYRVAKHFTDKNNLFISFIARRIYHRISYKCSIDLPLNVKIGYGCIIHHGYGLVVNSNTIFGNNVTLIHNLTFADEKGKSPIIGDRVRFTPGAIIVGGVKIGNNSVIGANCVVTKDVPENDVAIGVPNRNLGHLYSDTANRNYWTSEQK